MNLFDTTCSCRNCSRYLWPISFFTFFPIIIFLSQILIMWFWLHYLFWKQSTLWNLLTFHTELQLYPVSECINKLSSILTANYYIIFNCLSYSGIYSTFLFFFIPNEKRFWITNLMSGITGMLSFIHHVVSHL